jgi:hypothetical protein
MSPELKGARVGARLLGARGHSIHRELDVRVKVCGSNVGVGVRNIDVAFRVWAMGEIEEIAPEALGRVSQGEYQARFGVNLGQNFRDRYIDLKSAQP